MEYVAIVAMLAVLQFVWFGIQVGGARQRCGIKAPAMTGDDELERRVRVHYNTLEQLVPLLPGLYAFAAYVHPVASSALGAVYLIGRFIYQRSYVKDPASRGLGFGLSFLPVALLLIGGLGGAIYQLVVTS